MNILNRVKGMVVSPGTEWDVVKGENHSSQTIYLSYVVPLVSIGSISMIAGRMSVGNLSASYSITLGIQDFLIRVLTLFIGSYIIFFLAETFSSKKDINAATKLVAYAGTPGMLAAIVANFSLTLVWVSLFGLYGIYLFWIGLDKIMQTPKDKKLIYCIVAVVLQIIVAFALASFLVLTRFL